MSIITIFTVAVIFSLFALYIFYSKSVPEMNKSIIPKKHGFIYLVLIGFLLRLTAAFIYPGHPTDMSCFDSWSEMVSNDGLSSFYISDAFTDYPPGYMYILFILGFIKNVFSPNKLLYYVILKLPAIICDILLAYSVYKTCEKHGKENLKNIFAGMVIFNPAIILNSSVWGQVDSVFTVIIVYMLILLSNKKTIPAYFMFALAIFVKPQALFYAPVLIFGIIDNVFLSGFSLKKFFVNLLWGLSSIIFIFLLSAPFGIENVISQYTDTILSYSYASVNAYNLWSALGMNWADLNPVISFAGYASIVLTVVFSAIIFFTKKRENRYFYTSALICFSVFMLTVKMHERYAFPAIILMLLAAIVSAKKEEFWIFTAITFVQFINTAHVLFCYSQENFYTSTFTGITMLISWMSVILLSVIWIYSKKEYCKGISHKTPDLTKRLHNITKIDIIAMVVITLLYSAVALFNLGDLKAPNTYERLNAPVTIDLKEEVQISSIDIYLGALNISDESILNIYLIDESGNTVYSSGTSEGNVFAWNTISDINARGRYLDIASTGELYIGEIGIWTGEKLYSPDSHFNFFDEQELVPFEISYRNSTYFDEIYHARTAYEFIHSLPVYEWTHPPLGKILISMGINIFGMTPFGWRIIGTLFGILMVPLVYIFAKKMIGITFISVCSALLFSFDFMHFTQTRIATIDVYVTFFIILMYLFMYRYYTMSFYDTPLKKTFIPLGLCGISMGLAIASKWTGIYAGAGLGVLFAITIFKRYRENSNEFPQKTTKTGLFCISFFILIPLVIYVLSYIPFMRANNTGFSGIIQNQIDIFTYHGDTVVSSTHPFSSPWYQWLINYRPIWYYSGKSMGLDENISAFGNPVVWAIGLIAFAYCVYDAIKTKDDTAVFLVIAYLSQLIPWIPVTRTTFIYHYFPCVPFLVLMTGYSVSRIYEKNKGIKKYYIGITVFALMLFVLFYPVISGLPVDGEYVREFLRWLPSWQLIG